MRVRSCVHGARELERACARREPEEPCCKPHGHTNPAESISLCSLAPALLGPSRGLSPRLTLSLTPLSLPRASTPQAPIFPRLFTNQVVSSFPRPSFRPIAPTIVESVSSPSRSPPRPLANPHRDPSTLPWLTAAFRILLRRGTEERIRENDSRGISQR